MLNVISLLGNTKQSHSHIPFIPTKSLELKKCKINVDENMEKLESSYITGGNVNCYGKQPENSSKKQNLEISYCSSIPFVGICPQKLTTDVQAKTCT